MEQFIVKHQDKITGMISCFDRIVFKGYLPISYAESMERFLDRRGVLLKNFKHFASLCSDTVSDHAREVARKAGRPFIYLNAPVRKEERAREIAQHDGVTKGLICVFSCVESCQSFKLKYVVGKPLLTASSPRCLCLYFYYIDREFGFMHVRIQT